MHATTSSSVSAPPSDHQGDRNPEPLGDRGVSPDRSPTGSLAYRDLGRLRRPTLTSVVGTPPMRRRWSYVRRLDKRTAVGGARPAVLQRLYRSPTLVPNSHVCGRARDSRPGPAQALELSRLWSARRLCAAGVGVMYGGWTSALALEVHGPRFSNACTDLQRMYPSLAAVVGRATPAPARLRHWSSHVCGRHAASAQALELSTEVGQAHSRWRCTARGSPTRVPISNVCTQVSRLWSGTRLPPRPKHADLRARPVSHAREIEANNHLRQVRPLGATTAGISVGKQAYKARNAPPSIVINEPVM